VIDAWNEPHYDLENDPLYLVSDPYNNDVNSNALNCDQAINELILRLPDFGSVFYALLNGWYLG
jgi:hypothetical protein